MTKQQREDLAISVGAGVTIGGNAFALHKDNSAPAPKKSKLPSLKPKKVPTLTTSQKAKSTVKTIGTKAFGKGTRGRAGLLTGAVVIPTTFAGKQISNKIEKGLTKRERKKRWSKLPGVQKVKDYTTKGPKLPKVQKPVDFTKTAGGPGSGVSHDNTEFINMDRYGVKLSPYVSVQTRRRIMDSQAPALREQRLDPKDISYVGQRTYVVKKLGRIMGGTDESWLEAPVQVLRVNGKYHLMDGHHRWLGAIRKGRMLKADIWDMSEEELRGSGIMKKVANLGKDQSLGQHGADSPAYQESPPAPARVAKGVVNATDLAIMWTREVAQEARERGYRAGVVTPTYRALRGAGHVPSEDDLIRQYIARQPQAAPMPKQASLED